jgi:NTE family protein
VCRSLDFHRANEVIEIGQELASIALDSLDALGEKASES